MPGEIEAAGEVVAAGLIARAIEPEAGEGAAGDRESCLNCGMTVIGNHCHNCGQSVRVHRTLMAFWHDFTHSILHFEGKIWRTLPLLFFKPGQLTRRYVHGERARFVSPLALFLFSVFLMFATFSWIGTPFDTDGGNVGNGIATSEAGISRELALAKQKLTRLKQASAPKQQIEVAQDEVADLLTARKLARGLGGSGLKLGENEINSGAPKVDAAIRRAIENPALLAYKMQANAYKFSWALIPISVPFVWLLFAFRREFKPYDHAIFVTYSLAFMSLLLIAVAILGRLGPLGPLRGPLIALVPPIHIYVQLRGAYLIGLASALWRTLALLWIALAVLTLFGLLLLMLGVSG